VGVRKSTRESKGRCRPPDGKGGDVKDERRTEKRILMSSEGRDLQQSVSQKEKKTFMKESHRTKKKERRGQSYKKSVGKGEKLFRRHAGSIAPSDSGGKKNEVREKVAKKGQKGKKEKKKKTLRRQ